MNYIFASKKDHLTLRELNQGYGHLGRTFHTESAARSHKKTLKPGAYISRLVNYKSNDVVPSGIGGIPLDGAEPHTVGWLVTDVHATGGQ